MIIATAGHVDHGKTLLVKRLTGIDTDRLEEEKARGLTIDLGFAYTTDDFGNRLGFVDVPGHIRFINNMLAGVASVDFILLVIAADDGIMPQTREHLAIIDLLDIPDGCVALTKTDRVEPERIKEVTRDIEALLATSNLRDAAVIPVSSISGDGVEDLQITLAAAAEETRRRAAGGYFRLPVDRCFSVKGAGLVVTGSVLDGELDEGDELTLFPAGEPVRVRSLRCQDQATTHADSGDRCAVNLAGRQLERDQVARGHWLSANPDWQPTSRCDLLVTVTDAGALRHRNRCHVHFAASHTTGQVATLEGTAIGPGEQGLIQVKLSEPLYLCAGDRVILRDASASTTIAGGRVLDPLSPARGRARPERLSALRAMAAANPATFAETYLASRPRGIVAAQLAAVLNRPVDGLGAAQLGDMLISDAHLDAASRHLLERFTSWHEDNPFERGLAQSSARRLVPGLAGIFDDLVIRLADAGQLVKDGNRLTLPGFEVTLKPATEKIWQRAAPVIEAGDIRPPVLHDLAKTLGEEPAKVKKALQECVGQGLLVRPAENRYFTPAAMGSLRVLLSKANAGGPFTVQQYRDVAGIGRNLTIEILEYFDRTGVTRRAGDTRQIVNPD